LKLIINKVILRYKLNNKKKFNLKHKQYMHKIKLKISSKYLNNK